MTGVVVGDRLDLRFPDSEVETVRLLGIDTPKVHTEVDPSEYDGLPDSPDGRDWLRNYCKWASDYMAQYNWATAIIQTDSPAGRRGYYGRLLVYVYSDGTNVNQELLRKAYARVYESWFSLRSDIEESKATAQENDVGVWSYEVPATTITTEDSGSVELVIASIHADAAGNDLENENGEYIVFTTTGDATLDFSGWTFEDTAGHMYLLPNGVML